MSAQRAVEVASRRARRLLATERAQSGPIRLLGISPHDVVRPCPHKLTPYQK